MLRPFSVPCVVLFLIVPVCVQADWPRFLGSNYDGVATDASMEIDWTAKPEFLWSVEVGQGYGIGTIVNDSFFQFDADPSGQTERLRCIDLESGKTKWTQSQPLDYQDMYQYERGPRASPTIAGDHLYTMGVAGRLTCRSVSDGDQVWTVDTNQDYGVVQNFFGVGCSPLVLGDLVIVMVGGSPAEDAAIAPGRLDRVSPNGSAVVALNRKTGKEVWRCGDDLASYSSPRPIETGGETLVLVFARSGLMAVDPKAGDVRWKFHHRAGILESVNAMVPVVDGNHVFISECYEVGSALLQVDRKSSKVVWRDPPRNRRIQSMRCHWSTPILFDGFLYGCSGRNAPDSDLRCIDFKTGEVQWSDSRSIRSALTRVGDMLVVLEERGVVQVIRANPDKFDLVAQWDLGRPDGRRPAIAYPCWAAPVVVGDKLILRGDRKVLCLQLATQ